MTPGAHTPLPPWTGWVGPRSARLVIVGEAWGEHEASCRQPFVGYSGKLLWEMLGEAIPDHPAEWAAAARMFRYEDAWIRYRSEWLEACGIAFTNVLALRPPNNALGALCGPKELGRGLPPLGRSDRKEFPDGPYLRPEFHGELTRLAEELALCAPNVVVAAGNTACWALLQATNIGSIRGNTALVTHVTGGEPIGPRKALPTYHPAGVLRQWSWRPIVIADLMKAWREAQWPELRRPERLVLVNPTLDEISEWVSATLRRPPSLLSCDVETGQRMIKCIGFARSRSEALVIPFVDLTRPGGSYWASASAEAAAWDLAERLLASEIPKVFQNGLYDLQYILPMGIRPRALAEDTMLFHHSLFPEMQKGLGFLGSVYTNEASWKLMRRPKADTEKRDE